MRPIEEMPAEGMRPIEEMPTEIARALEGVVVDLDDTLTRDGIVEAEAYAALHGLRGASLSIALVTGRPLGWTEVLAGIWPIDLAIGENGAGWHFREGRTVRSGYFHEDAEERARQNRVLDRVRARVQAELPDVRETSDASLRRCDLAFDVGESVRLSEARVSELVGVIERCGVRAIASSVHVHAIPGRWDKAEGAASAIERVLGVPRERLRASWLFVGDSGNDAAAFAFFEHTAGVANVRDHLHRLARPPTWVARSDRGRGFAEIAAVIGASRRFS
jgi:hypothetical protein